MESFRHMISVIRISEQQRHCSLSLSLLAILNAIFQYTIPVTLTEPVSSVLVTFIENEMLQSGW